MGRKNNGLNIIKSNDTAGAGGAGEDVRGMEDEGRSEKDEGVHIAD